MALARALAVAPQVLLLDEPLSALDAQVRVQLREEIRRIQLELGITTVFVTHDQAEALSVADRVGVHARRAAGAGGRPGRALRAAGDRVRRRVRRHDEPGAGDRSPPAAGAELLGTRRPVAGDVPAGGPVVALVRPEALRVAADAAGPGRVVTRTFSGAITRLAVALPDGVEVRVDVPSADSEDLHPGTAVRVGLAERPVLVAPAEPELSRADVDRSDPACRAWVDRAVATVEADARRSADTHLLVYPLPPEWGVELYLKDESTHPTGSLKHRLARSLFLYGLCSGQITEGSTVVEASSGSTAVSEAYFARMLGLPFVAVMPAATSPEKIALIEFHGGRCHLVGRRRHRLRRGPADRGGDRRPLPRPVHLRRAGHRLARQQQHRRVDLRAAGAASGTRCPSGSSSAPAPAAPAPRSAGTCATAGCPPGWPSSTRRGRRSSPAGGTATRRRRPAGPPASRASAGRGWSPRSCRRSSTG